MTSSSDTSQAPQSKKPHSEAPLNKIPSRIEKVIFEHLSPDFPKVNAFNHFIGWAVIFVILLALNLFIDKVDLPFFILPIIATVAILSAVYGYFSAKACGYFTGEFDLLYKEGLWWKRQTALSFSRIQHIDVSHGPIDRKYQIATIKFFSAGGVSSDLKIAGLPNQVAESLRAEILRVTRREFEAERDAEEVTVGANNG